MATNISVSESDLDKLFCEIQDNIDGTQKIMHYVYVWYERNSERSFSPFYVGMGTGKRAYNRNNRSKTLKKYISNRKFYVSIIAAHESDIVVREIEKKVKSEFRKLGFRLIDAEDSPEERKRRQAEGIASMPVIDGRRISSKTGRGFGRPKCNIDPDLIREYRDKRRRGEVTLAECCEAAGVGKSTWYLMESQIA